MKMGRPNGYRVTLFAGAPAKMSGILQIATAQIAIAMMLVLLGFSPGRSIGAEMTTLSVSAASDLRFVMQELTTAFEKKHPKVKLKMTFSSSGNAAAQILQNAPFDLFFSADGSYILELEKRSKIDPSDVFVYAIGKLVVWGPTGLSLDFKTKGLRALLDPRIHKIAVANPSHAPYGRAAVSALQNAGIYSGVSAKLVYAENVAQAAQYAQAGSAQAGLIAKSLVVGSRLETEGNYWEVPQSQYEVLTQTAALLNGQKKWTGSRLRNGLEFMEFVKSAEFKQMLDKNGFGIPEKIWTGKPSE